VTLDSPAGGTTVTGKSVTVTGKVVPTLSGSDRVHIKVHGGADSIVFTDGEGNFSQEVDLSNYAGLIDLVLTNPGRSIVQCGPASSPILLKNFKNPLELTTTISAAVEQSEGAQISNTATVSLSHVVEVTEIDVSWPSGTCPGPHVSLPAGQVLAGTESKQLGTVDCGILCPGIGTECEATARVDVVTSVGSTYTEADWHINITE
jgi:hypothetical protein